MDHYGNLTIKGIAESVGFKSPTTFINVFKKMVGLSPSVYQNMAKKGGATVRVSGNTLAVSADKNIDRIQVFDLSGRLTQTLSVNGRSYNATLTGLSGSLYIMKISYADGTSSTIKVPVI